MVSRKFTQPFPTPAVTVIEYQECRKKINKEYWQLSYAQNLGVTRNILNARTIHSQLLVRREFLIVC